MKKEDFSTRLLKLFFHIQGPFDECRQEIIYRACARALIQIVYSSLLLFLFYLLFGRFIELVRDAMPLPLFWTHLHPLVQGEISSSRLTFGQGRPVRDSSQKLQQKSNQSS